jgi:hypothetical protein
VPCRQVTECERSIRACLLAVGELWAVSACRAGMTWRRVGRLVYDDRRSALATRHPPRRTGFEQASKPLQFWRAGAFGLRFVVAEDSRDVCPPLAAAKQALARLSGQPPLQL